MFPQALRYSLRGHVTVGCPLCGELRRYRPSEVFLGFPDSLIQVQSKEPSRNAGGEGGSVPRVLLNFQHCKDLWSAHFIEKDCWLQQFQTFPLPV